MYDCPRCQTEFERETKFCPKCGCNLEKAVSPFDMGKKIGINKEFDSIITQGYRVNVKEYIRKGWEIFKSNAGGFIGYFVTLGVIYIVLSYIPVLGALSTYVLSAPLFAGFYIVTFKLMKNQEVAFADFFGGFRYFLPLLLESLVVSSFISLGVILLIIPGIYLWVAYTFPVLLIIDRRIDFWQAMEASRRVVTKNWFGVFGFIIALLLINLAGALLFGLGLLVTIPMTVCATAVAYDDIFGIESSGF